ncbi:MAG: retroviral-like aspartic protease family protein [Candidatus Obscuribacterales bacterium]|nr:retroviral-like aspartic protease family protein [Candidatus Obscuribacterales bacterium]
MSCLRKAIILFLIALIYCPWAVASDYTLAVSLFEKKQFSEAATLFKKSRNMGEKEANSAYYEALCYHHLGSMDKARAAYMTVINNYPRSSVARQALSYLLRVDPKLRKKHEEAVKSLKDKDNESYEKLPWKVTVKFIKAPSGHLIVPVRLNGVKTEMIFDTGAGITHCKRSWLTAQGIRPTETTAAGRSLGVGGEVATVIGLINIELGELARTTPVSIEQDSAPAGTGGGLGSLPLLGQNYFQDLLCEIDDQRRIARFTKIDKQKIGGKGQAKRPLAANEVPFYRLENNMVVTVKINGRECEMFFDTGASNLAFADRHLAQYGLTRPVSADKGKSGGVGGQREGYHFYIDSVKLGPIEKQNIGASVMINSNFTKPLLGQTFLSGLKYTIDPVRNVVIFE